MDVNAVEVSVADELQALERTFGPVAEQKGLSFELDFAENALPTILTDPQRLQQVLKNLLSNAFKFTDDGRRDAPRRPAAGGHAVRRRDARAGGPCDRVLGRRHRASASRPTSCA